MTTNNAEAAIATATAGGAAILNAASIGEALAAIREAWAGEIDWTEAGTMAGGAARYEVWGWTDETPEYSQDWILIVTLAE